MPGPKAGKPLGVRAVVSEKDDGDVKFELKHMSVSMKALGYFLGLWQLFMTLLVGYTGFCVLRVTVNKLDLILNSLALVFSWISIILSSWQPRRRAKISSWRTYSRSSTK